MKDRPIEIPTGVYSCASCTPCSLMSLLPAATFWTFVFITGHGGFIRRALKWYLWTPVSRLSFGMYLVHPILINLGYTGAYALQFFEPHCSDYICGHEFSFTGCFLYTIFDGRKPAKNLSRLLLEGCHGGLCHEEAMTIQTKWLTLAVMAPAVTT